MNSRTYTLILVYEEAKNYFINEVLGIKDEEIGVCHKNLLELEEKIYQLFLLEYSDYDINFDEDKDHIGEIKRIIKKEQL